MTMISRKAYEKLVRKECKRYIAERFSTKHVVEEILEMQWGEEDEKD